MPLPQSMLLLHWQHARALLAPNWPAAPVAGISSSNVPILVSVAGAATGANVTVRKPDGIAVGVAATYGKAHACVVHGAR